ncbi:MAG: exodeoxyribonuclease V subunit gamma, partial [SAR324 cluster bacterium]|nr:exodeoxyribonuclease V subunit gamma [SAR324 cluster bacterium]
MPELHYSNRLDRLIEPLAENLDAEDPFEKAEIVVPNFSLQKWISLQLAQRAGIAANLRFIPLEKALQEMIQFPLRKPTGRILITRMMLQRLLLERLREN